MWMVRCPAVDRAGRRLCCHAASRGSRLWPVTTCRAAEGGLAWPATTLRAVPLLLRRDALEVRQVVGWARAVPGLITSTLSAGGPREGFLLAGRGRLGTGSFKPPAAVARSPASARAVQAPWEDRVEAS